MNQSPLQQQVDLLQSKIKSLEAKLNKMTNQNRIRDTVFFDKDASTITSFQQTVTIGAGGGTSTFNATKLPDLYVRMYFKGQAYNVPVYKLI